MDDVSDEEDTAESGHTPSDTQTAHTSLFGSNMIPSKDLHLLHPPPQRMSTLCELYIENCDSMFKILHTPGLRRFVAHVAANHQDIPTGNYVEALLFAMYYAAITSLTDEQCLQTFQYGRDQLLVKYRLGTETALANANLLNTQEMGTLQALLIFLVSVEVVRILIQQAHIHFIKTLIISSAQ